MFILISALKRIIIFSTITGKVEVQNFVKFCDIFQKYKSKIVFYSEFLLACFKNEMFKKSEMAP